MSKNKKPLATEGNSTKPSSGEMVSGNELSLKNKQSPVNVQPQSGVGKDNSTQELSEEMMATLEKYGLPRKTTKRLWQSKHRLIRNWPAMKSRLENARPLLLQWEYDQKLAKRQGPGPEPRNPRGAGRKQVNTKLIFASLMVQRFMNWSDLAMAKQFKESKLICAVVLSLADQGDLALPARSTLQKYKVLFETDGLSKLL